MKISEFFTNPTLNEDPDESRELTPAELASQPIILARAGGLTVELDNNEKISIVDVNKKKLVVMPFVIWKQLCRS